MNKITTNDLKPDTYFYVRGKIAYSRLGRQTTDEERAKYNEGKRFPIARNYTHITIHDATIIARDPANPTLEEQYGVQSLYRSSNPDTSGLCFFAKNTSNKLPEIRVRNKETGEYDAFDLKGRELANGLDVTVVMKIFSTNAGNAGVAIDSVIVNEDIKYFSNRTAASNAVMRDLNIVFSDKTQTAEPDDSASAAPQTDASFIDPAQEDVAGTPATPADNPFSAAVDNPFSTAGNNENNENNNYRRY